MLRTTLFAVTSAMLLLSAGAPAAMACDRVASVTGTDVAAGTAEAPVRTIRRLSGILAPGQTGCLTAGQTFHEVANLAGTGRAGAPITITSTPGGIASVTGQIRVVGSHVRLTRLRFAGLAAVAQTYPKTYHLGVDGDDVQVSDVELTSPKGICLDVGSIDAFGDGTGVRADGFVLERSRVHGCGLQNLAEGELTRRDSGIHGVYLKHTLGARISDNVIVGNANRGLQLWPMVEGTAIEHNVLDGNGSNLNIGSYAAGGLYSRHNVARGNLITFARLPSCSDCDVPPGDTEQVVGNAPSTAGDLGNAVEGNCVFHADPARNFAGFGYRLGENLIGDPGYVDRAAGDFRLAAGSPCEGLGPRASVPSAERRCGERPAGRLGTGGDDVITGTDDPEAVLAGAGEDRLDARDGDDALCGEDGYDTLIGSGGDDLLDGGADADVADFAGAPGSVDADLGTGTATGDGADRLIAIEDAAGGAGGDRLAGDHRHNYLDGRDGNDRLLGRSGNDFLVGGAGADTVDGAGGDDRIRVRDGEPDVVACGEGADYVVADAADRVTSDCEQVDGDAQVVTAPDPSEDAPPPTPAPMEPTPDAPPPAASPGPVAAGAPVATGPVAATPLAPPRTAPRRHARAHRILGARVAGRHLRLRIGLACRARVVVEVRRSGRASRRLGVRRFTAGPGARLLRIALRGRRLQHGASIRVHVRLAPAGSGDPQRLAHTVRVR